MGRSFVYPDYQRHPMVLDLLWRGIGAYVAKNPQYHTLFGAVSISREYSNFARALIADSMVTTFSADKEYMEDVNPIVPLKVSKKALVPDHAQIPQARLRPQQTGGPLRPGQGPPHPAAPLPITERQICLLLGEQSV